MKKIDPETIAWAKQLLDDEMPYSFAAEAVGISSSGLRKALPGYKNDREWRLVWSQILQTNKKLRDLHYEFNRLPPK